MTFSIEAMTQFWMSSKEVFFDVMSKTPTNWPMP